MGEPVPHDPEDRPDPDAKRPTVKRADWLVGAEEGLAAELEPGVRGSDAPQDGPRLSQPVDLDADAPRASASTMLRFRGRSPGQAATPVTPAIPPVPVAPSVSMPAWDPGQSSVPKLPGSPADDAPARAAVPEVVRDFPMDDAEERGRISAQLAEQKEREAAIAARPHAVVEPQEFDIPTLPMPWWAQIPQQLRSDRRVQLGALTVILLIAVATFWPREEKTISVAHLKDHADRYADTQVRVGGRVSEVFAVGGSWAYTLVQGRDTIVVFSRTRRPQARERVVVVGTLSNGYLDGQSRAAIFEATR